MAGKGHTPGRWAFDEGSDSVTVARNNGTWLTVADVDAETMEELRANARLIAAAPALLAALKRMTDSLTASESASINWLFQGEIAEAKAAIAEATGA